MSPRAGLLSNCESCQLELDESPPLPRRLAGEISPLACTANAPLAAMGSPDPLRPTVHLSPVAVFRAGALSGALIMNCSTGGDAGLDSAVSPRPLPPPGASRDHGTSASDRAASKSEAPPLGGAPSVQLVGRFDSRDPAGPKCAWPGCRVLARFDGTRASVKLNEIDESWMLGAPSEWDVALDGVWQPKIVTTAGTRDYVIADGLPAGEHVVELYKRSEAQNGVTQFLGYDFGGGALLAPPPPKERRIEIIGDSQPAAFGIEGGGQGPHCAGVDHAAQWQNFHRSFGALLGEIFDAEVSGTAYSGKGMAKNIWHPDKETMPVLFPRALPNDPTSSWDFAAFVPVVVVVMIGGNDFAVGKPVDEGAATLAEFTDAYERFSITLRETYPAAALFLVTSPSVSDAEPAGRNARANVLAGIADVTRRRNDAGDGKVYAVTPPVATPSELTGCDGHGNPEFHRRLARDLSSAIEGKAGW